MRLQILLKDSSQIDEKIAFLKDWQELSYKLYSQPYGDCYLWFLEVSDEDFDKTLGIFQSREEAQGAFLSVAMENGWEEIPNSYAIYHAQFEGDKLIAAIKTEEGISKYEQTTLEELARKLAKYPRIVALSYDVVTYIKDVYPDIDFKLYLVSKELSKLGKPFPDTQGKTIEENINLIEKLLTEEGMPPISKPVEDCE